MFAGKLFWLLLMAAMQAFCELIKIGYVGGVRSGSLSDASNQTDSVYLH